MWFTEGGTRIGRILPGSLAVPVLSVSSTHPGSFAPGQQNAAYTVIVSNAAGAGAVLAGAPVTVTENPSPGLSLVSMSGSGWTCGGSSCTRGDVLPAGNTYPAITVTVAVAAGAASPQVNSVTVAGGGAAPASASDSTIVSVPCSISLSATGVNLPATGTSTPAACPNASQPNCGFIPEIPLSFSVTPSAACAWMATSSAPGVMQIVSGASGVGNGSVSFVLLNNTHTSQKTLGQAYTITVASGGASATYTVTQAGSGDSQGYREVYALI